VTIKVTFGNSGHPPVFDPTKASQVFLPAGNYKFTVDLGAKDTAFVLDNDLGFSEFMALSQTFNNKGITWGAADADGAFTDLRRAQQSMLIFRDSHDGQADLVEAPKIRIQGTGVGVFTYGKDN
jgi:hypothetical protein